MCYIEKKNNKINLLTSRPNLAKTSYIYLLILRATRLYLYFLENTRRRLAWRRCFLDRCPATSRAKCIAPK